MTVPGLAFLCILFLIGLCISSGVEAERKRQAKEKLEHEQLKSEVERLREYEEYDEWR